MGIKAATGNAILLTGNLLLAGALFFCFYRKQREKGVLTGRDGAGAFLAWEAGWLLEFAVYGACVTGMADIIIRGIQASGSGNVALSAVRILLAESMMILFPIVKILCFLQERDGLFAGNREFISTNETFANGNVNALHVSDAVQKSANENPHEFMLGMLLLLGLTLRGWRESDPGYALARQLLCITLFFVYEYLERRRKKKGILSRENAVEEEPEQEEYFKNVEQQYQRTRELWHDLKNHIKVLEILAEEERFGELTDYLGSFRRDVEHRMVPMRTGCAAVDALLGDKLYYAGRHEVELSLQLCDLSRMRIREVDLCVILGNLLDNALEACARLQSQGANSHELCKQEQHGHELYNQEQHEHEQHSRELHRQEQRNRKRIVLRMRQEEDFYYITVVNTSDEPLREEAGYASGKRDRENGVGHGLGLRSAERVAHRYGGLLVTDYSGGEFRVVVRLQADGPGSI